MSSSSSSGWEEILSADSPGGSRRRSTKKQRSTTNNNIKSYSDALDSREDSPLNSNRRVQDDGVAGAAVPTLKKKGAPPPRNESFTMIDTPRGPRDSNLQAHSFTLPSPSEESSSSPVQEKKEDHVAMNPTGLPPRPPQHNNPPSPMIKRQPPVVTILNDPSSSNATHQESTPPLSPEQRSPGTTTNPAFPRIPPPRTSSQGSVSNNNPAHATVAPQSNYPLGLFPSATSMDSLVGGPQSLHFSPNTPMQQDQWKDVTMGPGGGGPTTPGSSMSTDCTTPYHGASQGGGELLGSMDSRQESSHWGDAPPSQSTESAPRDNNNNTGNSAVRNHQASLFSSVLAGFDDRSRERPRAASFPKKELVAKNGAPGGPEKLQNQTVPQAQPDLHKEEEEDDPSTPSDGLINQPTTEFRDQLPSSAGSGPTQFQGNQASEARQRAAEASRKATVESLTTPSVTAATTVTPAVREATTAPAPAGARKTVAPPASLQQHRWRPYLLAVYRWQKPRHSVVAVALVISFTTVFLPTMLVSIGPVRCILFGFAALQLLAAMTILLAGVPQVRPLLSRTGILDATTTTITNSNEDARKQTQKYIAKTIQRRAASLYDRSNLHVAIPQLGGYLWDKLLELADPTEAVQGEHEAAIKLIHSDRKRRQSLSTTNKHLDPFANVMGEEPEQLPSSDKEEEEAMETLLQQSAYFDSAAISAASSSPQAADAAMSEEQQKKLATMNGLVQEALRTERYALARKLFLMLATAIVVIEPVLDWAVNDASSPTSMFLFLFGMFICMRYPVRKILRREYIRKYGVTAGPFTQRSATASSNSNAASSPQPTRPPPSNDNQGVQEEEQDTKTSVVASTTRTVETEDEEDPLQRTFMNTVTASVRSFVIGPLEDEVEDSEVFSGRPSEEFRRSPSPLASPNSRAAPKPDDLLKQTLRDINRRRAMSSMNPPPTTAIANQCGNGDDAESPFGEAQSQPVAAAAHPVPLTVKWVVADACLLVLMGMARAMWKLIARNIHF